MILSFEDKQTEDLWIDEKIEAVREYCSSHSSEAVATARRGEAGRSLCAIGKSAQSAFREAYRRTFNPHQ
jgi:hypothetical protein